MAPGITIETFADLLAHGYRLTVYCIHCSRRVEMDLRALIAAGYVGRAGRTGYTCSVCGKPGQASISPGGAVARMP